MSNMEDDADTLAANTAEPNAAKDTSAEDLLGAERLVMSDSEDEESGQSEQAERVVENPNNSSIYLELGQKVMMEGEVSLDIQNSQLAVTIESSATTTVSKAANDKMHSVEDVQTSEETNDPAANYDTDEEEMKLAKPRRKKISALIDSDSEEESKEQSNLDNTRAQAPIDPHTEKQNVPKFKKKISQLIDSDSDEERELTQNKSTTETDSDNVKDKRIKKPQNKKKKVYKKLSKRADTGSEDELQSTKDELEKRSNAKAKISNLVDSESAEDNSESEAVRNDSSVFDFNEEDEKPAGDAGKNKKPKKVRASAKKALDEIQAIQSEQQRLHREANISIPYHKPKRYTLQEFLKRRTIIRPSEGSLAAAVVKPKNLKMTPEELAEYANLMEERAKEATEFFKSESDDEADDEQKELDKHVTHDEQRIEVENASEAAEQQSTSIQIAEAMEVDAGAEKTENQLETAAREEQEIKEAVETSHKIGIHPGVDIISQPYLQNNEDGDDDDVNLDIDNSSRVPADLLYVAEEEQPTSSNKVIVTEVVELPKLDLNSLHLHATATPSPVKKSFRAENLKRIIEEKYLMDSPTLKGDPDMLIDLESGDLIARKPSGVDNLLERFIKTNKPRKHKTTETVNILSTDNGKLEMSKVNVHVTEDTDPNIEQKPGAAYFKLKENLKSIIKKKRLEELEKKKQEEKEYYKCLMDDDDEEEEDNADEEQEYEPETKPKKEKYAKDIVIDDEENALNVLETEDIESGDENADLETDLPSKEEENDDEITEENDEIVDEQEDSSEDSEEEEESDQDDNADKGTVKRKNRIIKACQDDSDDEIDFLKTQVTQDLDTVNVALPPIIVPLFEAESKRNLADVESELIDLCSGQFDETQKQAAAPFISQIPITQRNAMNDEAEELLELCSGTFDDDDSGKQTQVATQPVPNAPKSPQKAITARSMQAILSSDEENSSNVVNAKQNPEQLRKKKLTKRVKTKKAKLGFSDDEEEEEVIENLNDSEDSNIEAVAEDVPETFIDYDSEENEIVVEMTKKDRKMRAANFVEKEAELSESDWGSADEDEKNMDKYDIELGDEDEFDREKLRAELGQIHARKMLDEDIREVRQIQEMLFEDEETDGVGRQRQFRWKNAESGFSLDDSNREHNAEDENGESGDEESEHMWRKIRYEREQMLKERGIIESSQDHASSTVINTTLSTTLVSNSTLTAGTVKKINIITTVKKSTKIAEKKSSPFLISKAPIAAQPQHLQQRKTVRGSFLERDKETLTKLAGLTKGNAGFGAEAGGTAGTVQVKTVKSKNFVFATLTEEEHEDLKRKADDLMNSSSESGINYMKKPKMEPRRDKCFIDQLL